MTSKPRTATELAYARRVAMLRLQEGYSQQQVASLFGVSVRTVQRWWQGWQKDKQASFPMRSGRGRPRKLDEPVTEQLLSWIEQDPQSLGFTGTRWTAPRLVTLLQQRLGLSVHPHHLNDFLRRHGASPQLPQRRSRERDETLIAGWRRYQWPRVKAKAQDLHGTLGFADESGFLLAPLTRTTLALRGRTPTLMQRARHRDKVSVAAMLTLSPCRGRLRLYFQTYPDDYVDEQLYARFLRNALWHIRSPLVLVHDGGNIHKGPTVRALEQSFPRLHLYVLPPYAPELNPVEYVWTYAKSHRLANHAPHDVWDIERLVVSELESASHDQDRLRSFFLSTPLSWNNTTLFF